MKILFVNFIEFWGGGENLTYQVMDELRKRDHSIVLFSNTRSELLLKAQQNDFETYSFRVDKLSFLNFVRFKEIKKRLAEIKPDAIILNSSLELKTAGVAIKASQYSKVILMRGIPVKMKTDPFKQYLFSNVVSNVVVNSNYVRESVSNITKYLKNEPEIIYPGIPVESLKLSTGDTKNIAIVGRLSYEKGVDTALRIMQKVLISEPDAKLWVIGDGKEKEKLIRLASELGIQNSVNFFSFVQDVESLLAQCSMLIMTSRWEGFGLVLLESMRLKMPCLAFDHLAASEVIIDNETGFLIPDKNNDLMAERIVYLLSNPVNGQLMGQKGYDLLRGKFSIERSIDQFEELIKRN